MKRVESVSYTRSQVCEIAQIQTGKNRLACLLYTSDAADE